MLARVVDRENMRVVEPTEKLSLLAEAPHPVVVVAHFLEDHLDGDLTFQRGVNAL